MYPNSHNHYPGGHHPPSHFHDDTSHMNSYGQTPSYYSEPQISSHPTYFQGPEVNYSNCDCGNTNAQGQAGWQLPPGAQQWMQQHPQWQQWAQQGKDWMQQHPDWAQQGKDWMQQHPDWAQQGKDWMQQHYPNWQPGQYMQQHMPTQNAAPPSGEANTHAHDSHNTST